MTTRQRPAAKKATTKKAAAKKQAAPRKSAGKKTAAAPRRERSEPTKPDVDDVVDQLGQTGTDAKPPPEPPGGAGPVEQSTRHELEQLRISKSALASSAIVLARHVDQADSAGAASAAARELRMTLATAKSVLLPHTRDDEDDEEPKGKSNVTPPGRLEQMRRKAERRGRG